MYSTHIMNKGLKTLEIEPSSPSPQKLKAALITEEILYIRILNNHKTLMFFLILFHLLIISMSVLNTFYSVEVIEEKLICQQANNIKNAAYVLMNLSLVYFAMQSIRRSKALMANIHFYERHGLTLGIGMLTSLLILIFKFVPDLACQNLRISLFNALTMTAHLFAENLLLTLYTKWFVGELRTFGALIN